ncbi:MAG TPA: aminomethyl-transferring glycine dehydrogenase, partial [Planctomycetota bacterium]|nr:aminomethyl-transferring glycine dehydrogenase [Planctomycetota bacterium]
GTAAAEAMTLAAAHTGRERGATILVSDRCHPQTIAVLRTRAEPLGIVVAVGDERAFAPDATTIAALVQYPDTVGAIGDHRALGEKLHAAGALLIAATDLLALTLIPSPASFGADIALGNSQRFGVPLGFGGPHAAFFAVRDEFKRLIPGRIVGISRDARGQPALRLALQTREQHIRREKATSNICTAQALLANMAAMYAVYHGPQGLAAIARRVHHAACVFADGCARLGLRVSDHAFFDTVRVECGARSGAIMAAAAKRGIRLRDLGAGAIGVALDETVGEADVADLLAAFAGDRAAPSIADLAGAKPRFGAARTDAYLANPVFHRHRSETAMLRYLKRLESRDLSLTHSMIALGSCTMKLNATSEMMALSWPGIANLHPAAPAEDVAGYAEIARQLEAWLAEITGLSAVSLQPNAGSQGEYAGLLAIRGYQRALGQQHRDVCLIPTSAHGTNPATASMAGLRVVPVACDASGNIDLADLRAKSQQHRDALCCLMVTYPSTHGVFEEGIVDACRAVHDAGGQVYMDGANMNAQVGLTSPGACGADVCHLNLHKTFCIPHGGGGPGMGPIAVASHLAPHLPGSHRGEDQLRGGGCVSSSDFGSASILTISWAYIALMGQAGLTRATQVALLNANYIAKRLAPHYPVLYRGRSGLVAHECIVDLRGFKAHGIEVEDVAKRLIDFGFHAPTMSFPVPGTMMIEPTESESKEELDRFCAAMIAIHGEIVAVVEGRSDRADNPLKHAPHTAEQVCGDIWNHGYGREQAAFPGEWTRSRKFWPAAARIDNAYGDRNLICACPPMTAYGDGTG